MSTNEKTDIHLPQPSYWPVLLAFSVLLIAVGLIYSGIITIVGVLLLLFSIIGWNLENRSDALAQEVSHE